MRKRRHLWISALALLAAVVLVPAASSVYYRATGGRGCASSCHEITDSYEVWSNSTHRSVSCLDCHGHTLNDARRLARHVGGDIPETIRVKGVEIVRMMGRCKKCHEQEFAAWQAGPHGSAFSTIFLDEKHNQQTLLRDDCLRCHGSYYEGPIRALVAPLDTRGPWKLVDGEWANQPATPCFVCHQVHRRGEPLKRPAQVQSRPHPAFGEELQRPSVALFDRREMTHIAAADLGLPVMLQAGRAVRMSPDPRQSLCYACHAPLPTREVASGDDRTGIGVHEGISCLGCHEKHGQTTRASCSTCHPRLSNCGLDVEKMDTTFRSATSKHNIHFVQCADCHPKGVPKRRIAAADVDNRRAILPVQGPGSL